MDHSIIEIINVLKYNLSDAFYFHLLSSFSVKNCLVGKNDNLELNVSFCPSEQEKLIEAVQGCVLKEKQETSSYRDPMRPFSISSLTQNPTKNNKI